LKILTYPHPTLRHKSKPIRRVDAQLRQIIHQMFDLMYEAHGIGLAANQVDLPMRFFIVNMAADPQEGEEHVFINPVISGRKGIEEKEEGCLSLPELYGPVKRAETVNLTAYNMEGEEIEAELGGLFARVVQHENDHLDGVLFIDRLSETGTMAASPAVEDFEIDFSVRRKRGEIPDDEQIVARLCELEQRYC